MRQRSEKLILCPVGALSFLAGAPRRVFALLQLIDRLPQFIRTLSIVVSQCDLRFHVLGAGLEHLPTFLLFTGLLLGPDKRSHVFHSMNNKCQLAIIAEDWRINWTPKAFFKTAAFFRRTTHRVALHCHHVGAASILHTLERYSQIAHAVSARIGWIVRKHVE